jgi:hypothetical protein
MNKKYFSVDVKRKIILRKILRASACGTGLFRQASIDLFCLADKGAAELVIRQIP